MYIAAIDIGSNAARLLIKNTDYPDILVNTDTLHKDEYYQRVPLKSGIDTFTYGEIQHKTLALLTFAMCQFAIKMREYDVKAYRACATSAYRDAKNSSQVISRVQQFCGLKIEIISGDEEARLTRLGFTPPEGCENQTFLFADVGGGSTEISLTQCGILKFSQSFRVGSMRYVCNSQSEIEEDYLFSTIEKLAKTYSDINYIATGGCVKFMKAYLNGKDSSAPIEVNRMSALYQELSNLTPTSISQKYSIPLERADILTPASSIFLRIAAKLKAKQIIVPQTGVRNGIIAALYHKSKLTQELPHSGTL